MSGSAASTCRLKPLQHLLPATAATQRNIREHSRASANLAGLPPARPSWLSSAYCPQREHTSAYVSIRQHTSAFVSWHARAYRPQREHTPQHTPAYISILAGMRAPIARSEQGSSSSDAVYSISTQRHAIRHHLVPPHTPNSRCVRPPPRTLRA